ncbi:FKBP-type peptidyl-prolyl cis-trans isomerase [Dyella mobilis]|uniref:Peptidyl-prolyl cis-trans isomerase n=1 Tax=Dyella mobilis TaxID=1849582 RepID=A0ABS2KL64_9GAMM|nr:FKBP-type peptidyl-prolyl cis-trans isomerase [Dyella mobilis]MBM7131765.1 FKBP-type peptidyl-prolyl cis-trans isomerase [Dyella mobilis]GLQ96256.1 peptidyl-prolyl cis-trans isomerase [Dyella mobilis]
MYRPLALFATALLALGACGPRPARAADVAKLVVTDQKVGSGDAARDDDVVKINYVGWLYDSKAPNHHGKQFDSSYDSGQPLSFTLGAEEVIEGMESGVRGMRVGGKREIIVPSSMGYGIRGAGSDIPPGSALVFDIELLSVH